MSFLTDIFSGGAGKLVDSVGNTLDKLTTTKEEVMQHDLEVRKAEIQYQLDQQRLDIEQQKNVFQDVDSARKRDVAVETSTNASWLSKNVSGMLAIGTTILTFILFYILIFRPDLADDKSKDLILYVLGVLSAILTQVFSFYFGSSQGSQEKNRMLRQAGK